MGAVTTLLFCSRYKDLVKVIACDSPFSDLESLINELIEKYNILGQMVGKSIYSNIAQFIEQETGMDIKLISPQKAAENITIPGIFVHGKLDILINYSHSDRIVRNYRGLRKYLLLKEGDHNDFRGAKVYEEISGFLRRHLTEVSKNQKIQPQSIGLIPELTQAKTPPCKGDLQRTSQQFSDFLIPSYSNFNSEKLKPKEKENL